jgi:sirohydrochlorin ferrochelatase
MNTNLVTTTGYLLVVHGSRYFRYNCDLESLAQLVQQKLIQTYLTDVKSCLIETAYLELGTLPLSETVYNFSLKCLTQNIKKVKIFPLFLLAGVHVKEDIPEQVKLAKSRLQNQIDLEIIPHLGSYKNLINLLEIKFKELPTQKRILLAHGSCLESGNQECEEIARKLNTEIAYYSVHPSLSEKVNYLANIGVKSIAILPYFLFEGKITQMITSEIENLKKTHSHLTILEGKPLGSTPDLAHLISKILGKN